jgi:GNAT superfamily N-acetyltransferase
VTVEPNFHGWGIGSKLLSVVCAHIDATGDDAELATDQPITVRWYQRCGFTVLSEDTV